MPWRVRRVVIELVLGAGVLALGVVVLVLNQSLSTELLASVAVLGGLAIVINALPVDGNGNGSAHDRP